MTKVPAIFQLFSLVLLIGSGVSCSKGSSTGGPATNSKYYTKFKVNNEQKEYRGKSSGATLTYLSTDQVYQLSLGIFKNDFNEETSETVTLNVYSRTEIKAASVFNATDTVKMSGLNLPKAYLTFSYNPSISSFISPPYNLLPYYPHLLLDGKITVTEIGTDYVKGTFSTHVYDDFTSVDTAHVRHLTDGEFYLPKY